MAEGSRIDMRVDTAHKMSRLAADLRENKEMRKALLKELRKAGRPVVKDVRRAVLSTPSRGVKGGFGSGHGITGSGLRSSIAKAVGLSISTSKNAAIRIRVNNRRVQPATLPKYLDGELTKFSRWRHPVYGNRDVWVQQDSHPYFFTTIKRHRDDFRKACLEAIDDVIDELSRG